LLFNLWPGVQSILIIHLLQIVGNITSIGETRPTLLLLLKINKIMTRLPEAKKVIWAVWREIAWSRGRIFICRKPTKQVSLKNFTLTGLGVALKVLPLRDN
jgi:hypothetical protein